MKYLFCIIRQGQGCVHKVVGCNHSVDCNAIVEEHDLKNDDEAINKGGEIYLKYKDSEKGVKFIDIHAVDHSRHLLCDGENLILHVRTTTNI